MTSTERCHPLGPHYQATDMDPQLHRKHNPPGSAGHDSGLQVEWAEACPAEACPRLGQMAENLGAQAELEASSPVFGSCSTSVFPSLKWDGADSAGLSER